MYEEERLFFADQCGPRIGFIGNVDVEQLQKERARRDREERKIRKTTLKMRRNNILFLYVGTFSLCKYSDNFVHPLHTIYFLSQNLSK